MPFGINADHIHVKASLLIFLSQKSICDSTVCFLHLNLPILLYFHLLIFCVLMLTILYSLFKDYRLSEKSHYNR